MFTPIDRDSANPNDGDRMQVEGGLTVQVGLFAGDMRQSEGRSG